MPSKPDYMAIASNYQISLDEIEKYRKQLDMSQLPDAVKNILHEIERMQKMTTNYYNAGK